ncbi:hypothetical protein GOODEAATRI_000877 [Goodea atripinnis]|uniref:Microtubule-actin crosslinking factor 1 n=1 Tax=Goodea atripinnis TaxID=208336 RepID=A0ABV0MXN8_9TELE
MFVTEVNSHREHIIELDKTGTHLKYFSQKQDVVLIKNLLLSVQGRWEKLVQRSVERGRLLDDARKRAKQVFQKELGKRPVSVQALKRSARELVENSHDDSSWVKVQMQDLSTRWDTVCNLSVSKQARLEQALCQVQAWVRQHQQRLAVALTELLATQELLENLLTWLQWAETNLNDRDRETLPQEIEEIKKVLIQSNCSSKEFPTSRLEMSAVADIFDRDGDGYIDYYEFVAALHPNKDAYKPLTDADKIEDELRLVRILRSTVMVRVGGGWMALDEFLVKNDPCRGTFYENTFRCDSL